MQQVVQQAADKPSEHVEAARSLEPVGKGTYVEPEHRRDDGRYRCEDSAHEPQPRFSVDATSRLLSLLGDPIDNDPAAAVRHRGNVFGEIGFVKPPGRRQTSFPVEVIGFGDSLRHRLVDHLVGQRTRIPSQQTGAEK
jgi:hypothetical protein